MILRYVFLIVFMLILWLPIVQMATGFSRQPTVDENRNLAPVPEFKSLGELNKYPGNTVKWFNDHYGFRDFMIRAKTQIDYSIFGMSTRVHVGKDGWLFYRSVVDIDQPQIELVLRKNADDVIEGTRRLASKLEARGIKLVIMIAPMKNVFYSEYLPNTAKHLPAARQLDLLQNRLKSMKDIIFIDSTSILRKVASKRPVFHKTDFHWNDPAAFEVASILVNEIGKLEGRVNPVWSHKLEIEEKPNSGGEANFMPIFFPPTESALFVKQNWIQPAYNLVEKQTPFEWIYEPKEPSGSELQPIVVFGDSFFDGMLRSGIWVNFKKVYRARTNDIGLKELVSRLPADTKYLFLEFIETDKRIYADLSSEGRLK